MGEFPPCGREMMHKCVTKQVTESVNHKQNGVFVFCSMEN